MAEPFLVETIVDLREELLTGNDRRAEVFAMLRSAARSAPFNYAWFTPFVALVTRDGGDIDRAKQVISAYLDKLEPMAYCSGLQHHFWCFAFPHAKVCLAFQWLTTLGAYNEAEAESVRAQLLSYHALHFLYGLRTKPDPECVDNQTLSLSLSAALVGLLFDREGDSVARLLLDEGLARLPGQLGGMDPSGYSGEGSAYMDCVVGPAVPLTIELLERATRRTGLLFEPLPPHGSRPVSVLHMVARSFMPGGLMLPWDNYGYQLGVRSTLAYGARQTGHPLFRHLLNHECVWTYDIGIGWAYDDLVWTLIWWPSGSESGPVDRSWAEPTVGGALAGDRCYAALLWDDSAPVVPTRAHVNPGMVLFNAFGVPLSADGSPAPGGAPRFQFADTWRTLRHFIGEQPESNFGDGCAGAHSVILLDGNEGLRALTEGPQHGETVCRPEEGRLEVDVTPLYRQTYPDVRLVRRRLTRHPGFFTVEDWVRSDLSHRVTSRYVLRPEWCDAPGACIRTPEGARLQLVDVAGTEPDRDRADGFPHKPDGTCRLADFTAAGTQVRRLVVAWPSSDVDPHEIPIRGWTAVADPTGDPAVARESLSRSPVSLDLTAPAHLEAGLPVSPVWWYRLLVTVPDAGFLRLPLALMDPQLFLDGAPVDLAPWALSGELLRPLVPLPAGLPGRRVEVLLRTGVPLSHYDGDGNGTTGLAGGVSWVRSAVPETLLSARWDGAELTLVTDRQTVRVPYRAMEDA